MGALVPANGYFIGSGSSRFVNQTASDIYFHDYLNNPAPHLRVSHTTTAWGVSIVYVEVQAVAPGPWVYAVLSPFLIMVATVGQAPQGPGPGALPGIPAPGPAVMVVGGALVVGHRVLWNHRVNMNRTALFGGGIPQLHYHQHLPRTGHGDPSGIDPNGSHYIFRMLTYYSQVQNFRKIMP